MLTTWKGVVRRGHDRRHTSCKDAHQADRCGRPGLLGHNDCAVPASNSRRNRAALSLSYVQTVFVEALIVGLIIGCCISIALLHFFEKLPTRSAVLKSEILSLIALAILFIPVQIAVNRAESADAVHVFLIGAALNVPRFTLQGLVIGYLYGKAGGPRVGSRPVSASPG